MKWPIAKLESVALSQKGAIVSGPFGSNIGSRFFVEKGVPVIRGNNLTFGDRRFVDDGFVFLTEQKAQEFRNCEAIANDLIFTAAGTIGQVGIIPSDSRFDRYIISNKQLRVRCDRDKVSPMFLFLWFTTNEMKQQIVGRNTGCSIPLINLGILRGLPIPLPPLTTQVRIADAISAYDDLIENNRRRMALLEESARLLYREWFVSLRFPGHEHAEIVDGIPKGWSQLPLESVCMNEEGIQTGPFGSQLHQSDYSDSGVPVVMPKDLISFRIEVEEIARIPESLAEKLSRHRMIDGDTVYGRRGDIGRRALVSARQVGWICGTGCLRIRPNPASINPRFLFDALGSPETAGTIANRAKGATMLNLNSSVLKSVPVIVASRRLQDLYADHVEPTTNMIELLSEMNRNLTGVRNLLIPRLMSGEIAV
jgi:type I restriction enzyme S subunit